MMSIGIDKYYKIKYNPQNNKFRFYRNWVGPQTYITLEVADYTYTNLNSIFVNRTSGNDTTGDGTSTNPYKTLAKGANSCTLTITKVIVQDAGLTSEDLSTVDNAYVEGIYAATGITATYTHRLLDYTPSDSNTIYVKKTGSDSNAGTYAAPKLTISAADAAASAKKVMILDSETYSMTGKTVVAEGWYAALGQSPTVTVTDNTTYAELLSTEFSAVAGNNILSGKQSNGNFVIAFRASHSSNYGKFMILDSAGSVVKAVTTFASVSVTYVSLCVLADDSFAIAYVDTADSNKGKYVVYDSGGNVIKAITVFSSTTTWFTALAPLSNGNFVLAYSDNVYDGKFIIFDSTGTIVTSATTFESGVCQYKAIGVMSNDNFIIAYEGSSGTDYDGQFVIYNSSGSSVKTRTNFTTNEAHYINVVILANNSFVIVYKDQTDTGRGKFIIFNSSGTQLVGTTQFAGDYASQESACTLTDGNFIITYCDVGDSQRGKFVIYNSAGTVVKSTTIYEDGGVSSQKVLPIDNGQFIIFFLDNDEGVGRYIFTSGIGFYGLTTTTVFTINGITFDGANNDYLRRMFNCSAKLTRMWCDVKNVESASAPTTTYATYSTSEIESHNCLIHDNSRGDYSDEATGTYLYNAYYRNIDGYGLHVKGAAATSGAINIQHNTFFNNKSGLRLESNHGTNETVKNNIFADNDNYDINATTAMTTTYSILTGTVNNCTLGTGTSQANPLFVNDGAYDETETDLTLKMKVFGDYATSPAYQLADDSSPDRDAGCWDTIPIGEGTTWSTVVVEKPDKGIEKTIEYIGARLTKNKSGLFRSSFDGRALVYTIKHEGMRASEFEGLDAMLDCGNSEVQFYGNPTTNPYSYETMTLIYETVKASAKVWCVDDDFRQDVTIKFARPYSRS